MDGIHDFGGKQGYGKIDRSHEDDPFHGDHDARAYGVSVSLRAERPYPIDWFRHVRELIDPVDYLTRPYFDSWLQTSLALAIDAGVLGIDEVTSGKPSGARRTDLSPLSVADVKKIVVSPPNFERESDAAPAFSVGDQVRTAAQGHSGHTRLPAYARNAVGIIHASCGVHPLPDAEAGGQDHAEHLYRVAIRAADLFPEVINDDVIYLDLWESYLAAT